MALSKSDTNKLSATFSASGASSFLQKRKSSLDMNSMAFGKLPPQAIEVEEAVLGAIMLDKGVFDLVVDVLKPECFYVDANQRIYKAMRSLALKSMPIDLLTVVEELRFMGELEMVGGAYAVSKLTNNVVSTANVQSHAHYVLEKFIQRELIKISSETISEAFEDTTDVFDLMDKAESKLFEITNNHLRQNFDEINAVLVKTVEKINDLRTRKGHLTGVNTGFKKLNTITYGWQPSDLIILAARPSVGKTAFALNLARAAALAASEPVAVGFFSLEMSSSQLVQRILSAESEINMGKISRGNLEDYEMEQLHKKGITPLSKAPIFIDETPGINIFELRAKCRRLKNKHNVGLIIIDYLQLMTGTGERNSNREQEISKISRDLKSLAKELKLPIIALSQLSREVEKRNTGTKMPQLSDLRESGAIEQDADLVMFLYRPEYHGINETEGGDNTKGLTQVRIAKHRNGDLATIDYLAKLEYQKFIEIEENFGKTQVLGGGANMGNWRQLSDDDLSKQHAGSPVSGTYSAPNAGSPITGANLYIEKGSKMNDPSFNKNIDDTDDDDTPFTYGASHDDDAPF